MKTISKAAKEYSSILQFQLAFLAGVKFAQQWIPVEEGGEKWDNTNKILLKDENGRVWTYNEYCKESTFIVITHWRPIELK